VTTAEKRKEARDISLVFHAALVAYGLDTIADSLTLYDDVQPTPSSINSSGGRWLSRALDLLSGRRRAARDLAFTYYQLHRALHTGYAIPLPGYPATGRQSLAALRERFFSQVEQMAPGVLGSDRGLVDQDGVKVTTAPPDYDESIPVDSPAEDLDGIIEELDDFAEQEARSELTNVGLNNLDKMLGAIKTDAPAQEVDQAREAAHQQTSARQAATSEGVVLDGARDNLVAVGTRDQRIIGFARVSGTGSPCGWCAMLISRGAVYRSYRTGGGSKAGARETDTTFHRNCKCYAEPIYSTEQYDEDDRFDLNRKLSELWPQVIGNARGKAAVSVWRRYIRRHPLTTDRVSA